MAKKDKPSQMAMLEARGVHARDYFRFTDAPDAYYAVTRSYQFLGLDGEPEELTEDDIWERYEAIEKVAREEYERAQSEFRDRRWRALGQPDARELEAMAPVFLDEYLNRHEARRWLAFCGYDEETLRRLLDRIIDALVPGKPTAAQRQKKYQEIYRELVLAKASLAAGCER